YLIKSSDRVIAHFDKHAPRALVGYLSVYTRWVGQLGSSKSDNIAGKLVRRWIWQITLNLALATAVFIGAAYVAKHPPQWVSNLLGGYVGVKSALWFTAVLVSLPLLIAIFRKLQALGLLLAELSVKREKAGEKTDSIRSVISQIIPLAGVIGLGFFVV